jgi:GMP synthase (glutamine-hydrolysing)
LNRGRPLLVIDPSTSWPETQGVAVVTDLWDGPTTVWTPALDPDGDGPRGVDPFAAVILLGSRASVHDDAPWIRVLRDVLGPVVRGQVERPLLGVCFGHQWLAHELGGEVASARADGSKIVGIGETRFAGGRLLPGDHVLRVVVSHREVVAALPDDLQSTAARDECAIDAFEHRDRPLFGVQFHPEARDEFARSAGFEPDHVDRRVRADSTRVLRAFLDLS